MNLNANSLCGRWSQEAQSEIGEQRQRGRRRREQRSEVDAEFLLLVKWAPLDLGSLGRETVDSPWGKGIIKPFQMDQLVPLSQGLSGYQMSLPKLEQDGQEQNSK